MTCLSYHFIIPTLNGIIIGTTAQESTVAPDVSNTRGLAVGDTSSDNKGGSVGESAVVEGPEVDDPVGTAAPKVVGAAEGLGDDPGGVVLVAGASVALTLW